MDEKAAWLPHAPSHVRVRAIVAGVATMVAGIALALAGAWIELRFASSPAGAPGNAERPRIAGAIQYTAPALEGEALLREKRARLHGRGTDAQTGEPFIPIEDAMRALVDEGEGGAMKRAQAIAVLAMASFDAAAHVGPHPEAGIDFEQHPGAQVPLTLPFVDERGGRATLGDALGHAPAVLVMGYVGCRDLCALTVPGAAEALDRAGLRAGEDYRAVFASIDAREDAHALAAATARVPAADRAGWRFLGGNEASARVLAGAVGFRYRYERDRDAFAHPAGLVVLSPDGVVSRYFFGVRFEPADLRLALAEAGQGRTGRLADRLLLLCYHFDPATGRHTPRILDALYVAIAAFAAGAALFARSTLRRRKATAGAS